MKVTVLGKSPAWEDAGGACSGYLVEDGETTLVLDCGNGVFGKLRGLRDYLEVDAVLISHLHADHILDLVPFAYALLLSPRQQPVPVAGYPGTDSPALPRLIAPRGAAAAFRRLCGSWGGETLIEDAFEIDEYNTSDVAEIGTLTARFRLVPHYVASHAINLTSRLGGGRFTFSADSSPSHELVEAARDTDLLLIEATVPRPERTGVRGHLTPAEAGDHARRAGAKRVVLTHISDEIDPEWATGEAAEAFGGPVEVAREGAVYEI
ncbi:MAG TPA: MBL fold metallo-hydrolase [Solirubrobacterales bacterium]|nr:MBL fold metallo-hydrolase [Solirubrobacterales bacterium]